jgi:hypothetical protein
MMRRYNLKSGEATAIALYLYSRNEAVVGCAWSTTKYLDFMQEQWPTGMCGKLLDLVPQCHDDVDEKWIELHARLHSPHYNSLTKRHTTH